MIIENEEFSWFSERNVRSGKTAVVQKAETKQIRRLSQSIEPAAFEEKIIF